MKGPRHQRRRRTLATVWLLALSSIGLATGVSVLQTHTTGPDRGKPVLAGVQRAETEASTIQVRLPAGVYTLARTPTGWVLRERGNYRVKPAAVEALLTALGGLRDGQKRTNDPALFDTLAVANPEDFGNGVRITVTGKTGTSLADVLVGQRGATFYVRQAGDNQVYRGSGRFPDLRQPAAWLDFDFPPVDPERIERLDATLGGMTYAVVRRPDGGFGPETGSGGTAASGNANATAAVLAVTGFQPEDVRQSGQSGPAVLASHVWQLRDGRTIGVDVVELDDNGGWVRTSASAPAGSSAAIRDWVGDWNGRADGRDMFLRSPVLAPFLFTKDQVETEPTGAPE
ncbi:MAG: DUF4340 domain-containing protein [Hyphomonadaceae bacterium]|nr:DUF4340 domain-containing protein [Hyphomonadaceae bacterium]